MNRIALTTKHRKSEYEDSDLLLTSLEDHEGGHQTQAEGSKEYQL